MPTHIDTESPRRRSTSQSGRRAQRNNTTGDDSAGCESVSCAGSSGINRDKLRRLGELSISGGLSRAEEGHAVALVPAHGKYFAIRTGFYYDKTGKISNPTFGIGLRFAGYGFDFGYTYGEQGHPLTNTMRFSLNMEF